MCDGSRSRVECDGVEGVTPVDETVAWRWALFPSSTGPVKSGVNLPGPPGKPEYFLVTDSGQVP